MPYGQKTSRMQRVDWDKVDPVNDLLPILDASAGTSGAKEMSLWELRKALRLPVAWMKVGLTSDFAIPFNAWTTVTWDTAIEAYNMYPPNPFTLQYVEAPAGATWLRTIQRTVESVQTNNRYVQQYQTNSSNALIRYTGLQIEPGASESGQYLGSAIWHPCSAGDRIWTQVLIGSASGTLRGTSTYGGTSLLVEFRGD